MKIIQVILYLIFESDELKIKYLDKLTFKMKIINIELYLVFESDELKS